FSLSTDPPLPAPSTPSLHDALPILRAKPITAPPREAYKAYFGGSGEREPSTTVVFVDILNNVLLKNKEIGKQVVPIIPDEARTLDRKSTRLNSSHLGISYAVFCLKK